MALKVVEETDTLTHIALTGQLTVMGVERVTGALHEHVIGRGVNTIIDMTNVSFIASSGINLLLDCRKQLLRSGAKIVLLGLRPDVEHTLRTARMDKLFDMVPTLEEAKGALACL